MVVVFFGTPEFAVPSLRALVGEGFDVVAVVTQPDAAQGRSRSKLIPPPVKVAAEAEDLLVLQPEKPKDPAFLKQLRELKPDIGVVVAYGHILKPELLALPPRGMINVHPSLLPGLRGAAPIEWAIIRGHDPRPGAWTELKGVEIKLFTPKVMEPRFPGTTVPGEVLSADGSLVVATGPLKDLGSGSVEILEVQPAGKERMPTSDWVRG